jgi:hypothetical protein
MVRVGVYRRLVSNPSPSGLPVTILSLGGIGDEFLEE